MNGELFFHLAKCLGGFFNNFIEIDQAGLVSPFARVAHKLAGQIGTFLNLFFDFPQSLVMRMTGINIQQQQGNMSLDGHQEVIEGMRNPPCQGADGFQLGGKLKLGVHLLFFGYVAHKIQGGRLSLPGDTDGCVLNPYFFACLADNPERIGIGKFFALQSFDFSGDNGFPVFGVNEFGDRHYF